MQKVTITLNTEQLKLLSYLVTSALEMEAIECESPNMDWASEIDDVLQAAVKTPTDVDMSDSEYTFVDEADCVFVVRRMPLDVVDEDEES